MLEAYRRQVADYLETQRRTLDDAGRTLVADERFRTMDVYQRDVAVYVYHLFATMAAMDGDISPDEMLVMLFGGVGGIQSAAEYFDAIETIQDDLRNHSEYLDDIPEFLEAAAAYDSVHGSSLAATLAASLKGMAAVMMRADLREDASERLFLERLRSQLDGFLANAGLRALPGE
ncbi:MAG: hypothetical protein ACKOWF_01785 [Chloroflexota bacterium]